MKDINEWFLSLPKEHQKVLLDDKWHLASSAYKAGYEEAKEEIIALKEIISSLESILSSATT